MPRIRAENIAAHKAQTRHSILEAATKVFTVEGFSRASLGTIADLAGIGRSTIYEYFDSKESLLVEIVEDRVPPILERIVGGLPVARPRERLEALVAAAFGLVGSHVELAVLLFRVGRELPKDSRDRLWAALSPVTDEILRLCSAGISNGDFAYDDAELLASVVADHIVGGIDDLTQVDDPFAALPVVLETRLRFVAAGLGGS